MSRLDYGYISLNKKGEELCGDKVECIPSENGCTLVLADGLGSGVKANILSTLTSKILCTMIASGIALADCIDTIISSLPVCKVRGVAYSTFSIISMNNDGKGYLVEFDNPLAFHLSGGVSIPIARSQQDYNGKKIFYAEIQLADNDIVLLTSDGVVHAGVGQLLNFGWERKEIQDFLEMNVASDMSARTLASLLANACYNLYNKMPGDDTTVLAVKRCPVTKCNLMIGPPTSPDMDNVVVGEFLSSEGKKIVCGGTSSQIVARYLKTDIATSFDFFDRDVPPIGYIKGVDLTTEGVLTLKKLMVYADDYLSCTSPTVKLYNGKDGASLLAELLFIKSTDILIFVGRSVNLAHEGLGIDNKLKLDLVQKLFNTLRALGKTVTINYY